MDCLRIYKCGDIYKYISTPIITQNICNNDLKIKNKYSNTTKLYNNVIRAQTKIKDLILCNDFKYFITITFNSNFDRFELGSLIYRVTQKIRDYRRSGLHLDYILIPERHKNGAWHLHGCLSSDFSFYIYLNKYNHYNCKIFDCFGFNSISTIRDKEKISFYVTKYITKDFAKMSKGKHLYFCSTKLNKPIFIKEIFYKNAKFDYLFFDFSNDFCSIKYDKNYNNLNFLKYS